MNKNTYLRQLVENMEKLGITENDSFTLQANEGTRAVLIVENPTKCGGNEIFVEAEDGQSFIPVR